MINLHGSYEARLGFERDRPALPTALRSPLFFVLFSSLPKYKIRISIRYQPYFCFVCVNAKKSVVTNLVLSTPPLHPLPPPKCAWTHKQVYSQKGSSCMYAYRIADSSILECIGELPNHWLDYTDEHVRMSIIRCLYTTESCFFFFYLRYNITASLIALTLRIRTNRPEQTVQIRIRRRRTQNAVSDQALHCLPLIQQFITKTWIYNFDPFKPHFYIVKLGFTGVYIIFLICAQKHRLWVLVRTTSARRF